MSKATSFVKKGHDSLKRNTIKAIGDLLDVLDSPIVYPRNKDQSINEVRLLAVVKSRGQAYNSAVKLGDEIEMDRNSDPHLRRRFMNALMVTFDEMNKILVRDIRGYYEPDINDDDDNDPSTENTRMEISDDHISVISKTKEEAYLLNKQILDRIALLDDPEAANKEKLQNLKAPSIAELFADE